MSLALEAYLFRQEPVHPLLDPRSGRIREALGEAALAPDAPPVDPGRVKFGHRLPVTLKGKVVGHAEGASLVLTDETAAALLTGRGRLSVSIGPLDAPVVSGLMVRPSHLERDELVPCRCDCHPA